MSEKNLPELRQIWVCSDISKSSSWAAAYPMETDLSSMR